MQLDPFQTRLVDLVDILHRFGILGMNRGKGDQSRRGNTRTPAENRLKLTRLGGNGEHHRGLYAQPVHFSKQGGNFAVQFRRDFGPGTELGHCLFGQGIGKGMGVEIDDPHWILCITEKRRKGQGYGTSV